jgi:hypothetical protein
MPLWLGPEPIIRSGCIKSATGGAWFATTAGGSAGDQFRVNGGIVRGFRAPVQKQAAIASLLVRIPRRSIPVPRKPFRRMCMRNFIERQGGKGLKRVRNRFGGESGSGSERGESRRHRDAVRRRDERRVFSRLDEDFVLGGLPSTTTPSASNRAFCPSIGIEIPAGGGRVRLEDAGGSRRPTLYFSPTGNLTSAHF